MLVWECMCWCGCVSVGSGVLVYVLVWVCECWCGCVSVGVSVGVGV